MSEMPRAWIDHLVVSAPTLASGADWVERELGVPMQPGGLHPRMGTHNRLLRLGPSTYLEVIAVDPAAPPPGRPRWFELDGLPQDSPPRLVAWVARTDDIQSAARAAGIAPESIETMSRDALTWQITLTHDGSLPMQGAAPALIQWQSQPHPALALADRGCALARLDIFHPEVARLQSLLNGIGFSGPLRLHPLRPGVPPFLSAVIQTPVGQCQLAGI